MQLRAPVLDDAPAVLNVLAARDVADLGAPDYTLEDLLDEWRASDLDLALDARVVANDDGQIVGYGIVHRRGTFVVVAPDHENRGIGQLLLACAEERERERGSRQHRQWIAASNAHAEALLRGAGYLPVRSYWRMVRQLDDVVPASAAPAGFRLRPLQVDRDAAVLHAVDDASFAGTADYEPEPFEAFREEHLGAHDLDAELSCVAENGDDVVGFLLARRWRHEAVAYVDVLAVHPDQQGRGLGTAILLDAFKRFARVGLKEAQLGVASNNSRALGLYERVGMSPRFQFDTYERPIRR